jgi:hypothetical protein
LIGGLHLHRISLALVFASLLSACSSSSPTTPTPIVPTPTPTPVPTSVSLTGVVTAQSGVALNGATVLIGDGVNEGRTTTTDGNGFYSFTGLKPGNDNIGASASGYFQAVKGINVGSVASLNFVLQTVAPFTMIGTGNNVFNLPAYITKVQIIGSYVGNSSNFIVTIGGHLVVNDLLGTAWGLTLDDGTYVTTGGQVQITNSAGVSWSFTEVR